MGGEEAQNITDIKTRDCMCEMRCIRVKTIEKMLILTPGSFKFPPAAPRGEIEGRVWWR